MRESGVVAVAILACGASAIAGAGTAGLYPLPNADFEAGLAGWSQWASDGSTPFAADVAPGGAGRAARCTLPPGVQARLELALPIGGGTGPGGVPAPGRPGEKVDFGAWVRISASAAGGEVWLSLESFDGVAPTSLAESPRISPESAAVERWLFLPVRPDVATDARVQPETVELRYVLHSSVTGAVWFDAARAGRFEYSEYLLENGSFEEGLPPGGAWRAQGLVRANDPSTEPAGYYGVGHVRLEGSAGTAIRQELALPAKPDRTSPAPRGTSQVEAGCWLRAVPDAILPPASDASVYVELTVRGISDSGVETLLAIDRFHPTLEDRGCWRFLHTAPLEEVPLDCRSLRVEVVKSFAAEIWVDFVQAGERFAIDGNPRRRVGCNYVGRYRSPLFPGCTTTPTAPGEIWRNWHWTVPNACNPAFAGFFHDPECATNPECFRPNGRRDLAISTLNGIDELPLVGSYDSRDLDVIRYHLDLAEAVGIDHFVYDYLGHVLAQQDVLYGREPVNEQTWEALVEVAEEPGRDFKLAVMYEPKAHYNGWVQGEPTEALKLQGMIADLVHLAEASRDRRSALRRDGRLVVFVFRNTICNPEGTQCLDDADWLAVAAAVEAATGEELFLVGDVPPGPDSPFRGLSRWRLVRPDLLAYRTYSAAEAGIPSQPPPRVEALEQHAAEVHAVGRDWAAHRDDARVAVDIVWPGFDDTGVGGWGVENLIGEDGLPLCVRVAHGFEDRFYETTVASATTPGCDWVQIATWNDWNERTRIEPAWHPDFALPLSGAVRWHALGRLDETRTWIAAFKGEGPSGSLERIALDYLRRAAISPEVTPYD